MKFFKKFFEKRKLKKKIDSLEERLSIKIFNEIFDPYIDYGGTKMLESFNHKKIHIKEFVFKDYDSRYLNTKNHVSPETYKKIQELDRLRKYLSLI